MTDNRTNLQRATDALLEAQGSSLAAFIAERVEDGASNEKIARDLWQATDGAVEVSASTIRNWRGALVEEPA